MAADTVYALSAVDKSGRVADRSIVRVLGWVPGTRLDIREQAGIIVVRPAADGVHCIGDRRHLRVPLAVRRWCRLAAGDRVLLAADCAIGVLVAHPLAVLDRLLADGSQAQTEPGGVATGCGCPPPRLRRRRDRRRIAADLRPPQRARLRAAAVRFRLS